MTDYAKLISDMEAEDDALRASQAVTPPGQMPTADFSGTPATARAVLRSPTPQAQMPTWEQMSTLEKVMNGTESGYNNLLKSRAIGKAYDRLQAEDVGLSALVDDDEDESVKELLARDTQANRDYKKKLHREGMEAAYEYVDLAKKDKEFSTPVAIQRAAEAGKDKGFWEGTSAALSEIAKDPFNSALYLGTSSFGAIAPYVALSALGGNAMGALGLTTAARAVSAAVMYGGSYQNEYGNYIADELKDDGIDLSNAEALSTALKSDKAREYADKAGKRAQLVAAFDGISGYAEMIRLNPSNSVRRLRNAMSDLRATAVPGETRMGDFMDAFRLADSAPKTRAGRFATGLENVGTQAALQGVMGGMGEATGSLAAGDQINWGDVLFEALGEFTSAPVEVVTMTAGIQAEYQQREQVAQAQQTIREQSEQITAAANAIGSQLQDGQSVEQWANDLGQDKVVFAFAQDLVDAGVVDSIAQMNPQLAESIAQAAEQKSDVSIPVSDVVKMATADKALADKVLYESRVDADGMSPHKADDFMKGDGKKEAVEAFEKIVNDTKPDIETRKEIEAERKKIRDDLVAAGVADDVADLQTRPWASWLAIRSKQTGLKPVEIMKRINLRIEREKAQGFNQSAADASKVALLPHPATDERVGYSPELEAFIGKSPKRRKAVDSLIALMSTEAQKEIVAANKGSKQIRYQKDINEKVQRAAKAAGVDLTDRDSPVTRAVLVNTVVNDAFYVTETNPSAIGWYDEKVRKCLGFAGAIFPELDPHNAEFDKNEAFRFLYALATTSNGLRVAQNLPLAVRIYAEYKRTGTLPAWGEGTQAEPMIKTLADFSKTQNTFDDIDQMREFFMTTWTVRQMELMGYDAGGEGKGETVRGAAIIGPKIGNGFFVNLNSVFSALTMDRWFMRTYGRWTGTLISFDRGAFIEKVNNFRRVLEEIKGNKEFCTWLKEYGDFDVKKALAVKMSAEKMADAETRSGDAVSPFMKMVKRSCTTFMPAKFRKEYSAIWGGKDKPNSIGWRFYQAMKGVERNAVADKVAPAGSKERAYIRSVFNEALDVLHGYEGMQRLTMADLQAALWYAEKKIYENTKAEGEFVTDYEQDDAPDYANVMRDVALERGVPMDKLKTIADRIDKEIENETANGEGPSGARYDTLTTKAKADVFGTRGFGALRRNRGVSVENGAEQGERRAAVYRNERPVEDTGVRDSDGGGYGLAPRLDEGGSRGRGRQVQPAGAGLTPVATWSSGSRVEGILRENQKVKGRDESTAAPKFNEYAPTVESATAFLDALKAAKKTLGPVGACVEEKSIEELTGQDEWKSQCRIFISEDGKSGFVIKNGDDLVSVFSTKGNNSGDAVVECAVAAGARRLDCFNTILPRFYALHGFRPVARLKFNRDYAPYDWDYSFYAKYNNGEPDVIFMVYDNDFSGSKQELRGLMNNLPETDGESYGEPYHSEGVKRYAKANEGVKAAVDEANKWAAAQKAKKTKKTKPQGFAQSAIDAQDAEYMRAVESGDINTARRMVAEKAAATGYANAIPEQAGGWTIRTGPAPTRTVKAYKVFFVNESGEPTTLFVGDAQPVPTGVWVDAKEGFSIVNPKNGRRYAPTFSNPNRQTADGKKKTGKTGETVPIVDEATKQELVKRGFVTEKAKSVTAVAFRPGWHAGTLPYFPQGGEKREGSNYGNVHEPRQVVYEIEVAADQDYTETARSQDKARTKAGKVNARAADLDYIPRDGMYYYTTNPMLNPEEDGWVISGSIKINRALSQEECDRILAEHGKLPQEWSQGKMNLADLGITDPEHSDAARKTLAPVTYDADGNVIPLSKRFNPGSPSALEQRAYHGSPYNFDSFTMAHIGTGEGSYNHGYGLYFTLNRRVAERYRDALVGGGYTVNSKPIANDIYSEDANERAAAYVLREIPDAQRGKKLSDAAVRKAARTALGRLNEERQAGQIDEKLATATYNSLAAMARAPGEHAFGYTRNEGGRVYDVEIPDSDVLLQEAATVDEQPEKVKLALKNLAFDLTLESADHLGQTSPRDQARTRVIELIGRGTAEARDVYGWISVYAGGGKDASDLLDLYGIKGMEYSTPEDGSCACIWDEKSIRIRRQLDQTAYHGSPYNFDKFSLDHIGDGEGAQAHGWGLYFALDRGTAENYRQVLTMDRGVQTFVNGREITEDFYGGTPRERALHSIADNLDNGGDPVERYGDDAVRAAIGYARTSIKYNVRDSKMREDELAALDEIEQNLPQYDFSSDHKPGGRTFEVEIPDDDAMLREGVAFGAQSKKVQTALKKLYKTLSRTTDATLNKQRGQWLEEVRGVLSSHKDDFRDLPETYKAMQALAEERGPARFMDLNILRRSVSGALMRDAEALVVAGKNNGQTKEALAERLFLEGPLNGIAYDLTAVVLHHKELSRRYERYGKQLGGWARYVQNSLSEDSQLSGWYRPVASVAYDFGPEVFKDKDRLAEVLRPRLREEAKATREYYKRVYGSAAKFTAKYGKGATSDSVADELLPLVIARLEKSGVYEKAEKEFPVILDKAPVALDEQASGRSIYRDLTQHLGSDKAASEMLNKFGIKGIRYNGLKDGECAVVWDEDAIRIREALEQEQRAAKGSVARGSFMPQNASDVAAGAGGVLTLMQTADKSTFLHESAHAWLDADTMLAQDIAEKALKGEELTAGEKAFLTNLGGFFRWGQQEGVINLGVTDDLQTVANAVQQWARLDVAQQRGMHELFAEGFESYLLEGVSPNAEMKTIFGRFKKWLMDIYAQATKQPHPISSEVRKLYDLMFAAEQQVQDVQQKLGLRALFDGQLGAQLGMTQDEMAAYQALNDQATQEAEGLVAKAVHGTMRIFGNIRRKEAARIQREHREEIARRTSEILEEPRFKALSLITHGVQNPDGSHARVTLALEAMSHSGVDAETVNILMDRGFVTQGKGVTPEVFASLAGTADFIGLVSDLIELKSMNDAKAEAVRSIAYREHVEAGESVDGFNELQANLAAYNETRSRFLVAEFNALARASGNRQLMVQAAREYAVERIGGMKLSQIYPSAYMSAERRCAKLAEEAVRKGDFKAALEAKRGQILNHEMARAALEAQDRYERGARLARRALKSKTIHPKFKRMILALLDMHSISNMTADERKAYNLALPDMTPGEMQSCANDLLEAGTPIEGLEVYFGSREHARDMTAYDSQDFFSVLKQLQAVGRNFMRQQLDEELGRVDEVIKDAKEKLAEAADHQDRAAMPDQRRPMTRLARIKDSLVSFLIDHVKIATWCRVFDENKDGGLFWKIFIRSANNRANFENSWRQKVTQYLAENFATVFKKTQDEDPVIVPGFDVPFTHGMRLAVALNWGNASNRERLISGDPRFTQNDAIAAIFEHLTEADWRAVESVWRQFEELRPLIGEKEERVFGIAPKWIEYKPFTVKTAEGKTIKVSGGYYPVKFDERGSNRADKNSDAESVQQEMRGAFQSATTRRSFTKSRVEGEVTMPLRLDLSALYEGFNDVIHDLAWHEWLIDTKRLLDGVRGDGSGLRAVIKDRYGYEVARQFEEWRKDIAQGGRDVQGSQIAKFTRNVGVATMGYSVTSAVVQLTGVGYVIPRVGVKAFSVALGKVIASPFKVRREINKQSEAMRLRAITMNREISQIRNQLENGRSWIRDHAYTMLVTVQGIVDAICWQAAYERFSRDGYSGDELIALCDQTVNDTQSSGNIHDLSRIERDPGVKRIFTVFYSWANAALNLEVCEALGERDRAKAYGKMIFMGCFMPVLEDAWREMLKASGDDDDDDEALKLLRESIGSVIEYHMGLLVGVREIANTSKSLVAGAPMFGYSGPAGVRLLSNANSTVQALNDPLSWKGLRAAIDLVGTITGLPATQVNRTIKGVRAIESGDVEGIDAVKAPVFGYSGKIGE